MWVIVYILYVFSPVPPIMFFTLANYGDPSSWFVEGLMIAQWSGIAAFTYLTGQLFIASRAFGIDRKFGVQRHNDFHAWMGFIGLAAALAHFILKFFVFGYGFSAQSVLGLAALIGFLIFNIFFLLFFINSSIAKWSWIKRLRNHAQKSWGWTYKGLRAGHNIMNGALVFLVLHIALAPTVRFSGITYPWLMSWAGLGLTLYLIYRFRSRKGPGVSSGSKDTKTEG